jgi:hypothetical protein
MPRYTVELLQVDDTLMARSGDREVPSLTSDEILAWARDAAEKFGLVWDLTDRVRRPTLGYARILCDGAELLRLTVPTELSAQ